jgi:hypothetical protein
MKFTEHFTAALFPDTHRVLGYTMQPYTIGHSLLLQRLGSPLVTPDHDAGPGDLKLAIAVCSRPFPAARRLVQSRWIAFHLARIWAPIWKLRAGTEQFLAYRAASERTPPHYTDGDKPRNRLRTPLAYYLRVWLITELHIEPTQALCTPLAIAQHDFASWAEANGALELHDDQDDSFWDEADQLARDLYQADTDHQRN